MTYYFTYGAGDHMAHKGGWTTIVAPDRSTAVSLFMGLHPCLYDGVLACSDVYTEPEFVKTSMYDNGNFGHREWETVVCVRRE